MTKYLLVSRVTSTDIFSKNDSMSEAHNSNIGEKKPDIYILYDFSDIKF